MSKEKRLFRDYDPEFRKQAAKLVLVEKMTISSVATDLGIPVNSLHTWVTKFRKGIWSLEDIGSDSSISSKLPTQHPPVQVKLPSSSQKHHDHLRDLEGRNRDLEAKLRRMTQERDILKKAMAYCLETPK